MIDLFVSPLTKAFRGNQAKIKVIRAAANECTKTTHKGRCEQAIVTEKW